MVGARTLFSRLDLVRAMEKSLWRLLFPCLPTNLSSTLRPCHQIPQSSLCMSIWAHCRLHTLLLPHPPHPCQYHCQITSSAYGYGRDRGCTGHLGCNMSLLELVDTPDQDSFRQAHCPKRQHRGWCCIYRERKKSKGSFSPTAYERQKL